MYTEETIIENISLHNVGNKTNDAGIILSAEPLHVSEHVSRLLGTYFLTPFKGSCYYNFHHQSDLAMNEVYHYVCSIFDHPDEFHAISQNIARWLFEKSVHPKIKSGEFYVVYFKDCLLEGALVDAVGLFKSENKETFLKVYPMGDNFQVESQEGVNINKLDKGCIIYNAEREDGFVVEALDNTNKAEDARYWMDDFLHIQERNDGYFKTRNAISMCTEFVKKELPQQFEVNKAEQAELLVKSANYFKEKDNFNADEFAAEVIAQPEVIESFQQFKEGYRRERDIDLPDSFEISNNAVKRESRQMKSVIKLDKNFHIYVHGNADLMIKGYCEESGMNYYQIFFKEES